MKKRRLLLLLCLLPAIALAACGGGEDHENRPSDEVQIEDAIESSATSSDPSECTENSTPAFLEQRTGRTGAAAVKACERERQGDDPAEAVIVSNIEVDGFEATADAKLTGSIFDGQTLTFAVVVHDGYWKPDRVTGFADLDKEALAKTFEKLLGDVSSDQVSRGQINCVLDGVRHAPDRQIEEALLDEALKLNTELQKKCGLS